MAVLLVHGFHPWAEDGGVYVAGVEYLLNPTLFPFDRSFVTAPSRYSVFAPTVAALVRLSHVSLHAVLLAIYLLSTAIMLFAALRIVRRCFPAEPVAQWTGVTLLAAWWTLPVAGTSLLLMDPYVTARTLSAPLTLLAVGEALALQAFTKAARESNTAAAPAFAQPLLRCLTLLGLAAAFHPLMAIHAAGFLIILLLVRLTSSAAVLRGSLALLSLAVFGLALALQRAAAPDGPAALAAVVSRYYWFLSQWQWFEWCGFIAPLVLFAALPLWTRAQDGKGRSCTRALCFTCVTSGLLALAVSLVFAREHLAVHAVARLQPLRMFVLPYALLPLLLGGSLASTLTRRAENMALGKLHLLVRISPWITVAILAGAMFAVQRAMFPDSLHVEWPGRRNPNAWVDAFVWIREHTLPGALVALDARYVNTGGEDAQTFRAIARRSALPDYSKDGGQAANLPDLAPDWQRSAASTANLSLLTDTERAARFRALLGTQGFQVQWLVLRAGTYTSMPCLYQNDTVKVCRASVSP